MMNSVFRSILILAMGLWFFVSANAFAARPFLIDTDVGIDDVIAILYLFNRSDIDVKAISIASDGNAHCEPALRNTLGLLKLAHYQNIPVACGRSTPLAFGHHFNQQVLDESDTLVGTAERLPKNPPNFSGTADALIIKTLKESAEPIDILAIGPLTNLAEVFTSHPILKQKNPSHLHHGWRSARQRQCRRSRSINA